MISLDKLIMGSAKISFKKEDEAGIVNALLRHNLSAKINNCSFDVALFRLKKYKAALNRFQTDISEPYGFLPFIISQRKRYGIIAAFVALIIYYVFIGGVVWDVRISGAGALTEYDVCAGLSEAGLYPGARWSALSLDEAETALLEKSEQVGWININRRGNVAYVTVGEKNVPEAIIEAGGYSNIIANEACVIEDISVSSGIAMVKPGDTVKAGQLLVSGVIPAELGGGFVRSEAQILGRVNRDVRVSVPRQETQKVYGLGELRELSLDIFNFSVKIYKNYGNDSSEYVIIKDTSEVFALSDCRLPLRIVKTYGEEQRESIVERSDSELVSVASARLARFRAMKLADSELLRITTSGTFTEAGYEMSSDMLVLTEVGDERFFTDK